MVQAARSGVQNIAEGSVASATSKKTELKLTGVAKGSEEELLRDYVDFLRQRGLRQWDPESPEAMAVRRRYKGDLSGHDDPYNIRTLPPEEAANTMICLVNQTTFLLRGQLRRLDRDFVQHGGFTERMYATRSRARENQRGPPVPVRRGEAEADPSRNGVRTVPTEPFCPSCARPMVKRTARQGPRAGQTFWGCPAWPACSGTRPG